jgi:hypothetical protein
MFGYTRGKIRERWIKEEDEEFNDFHILPDAGLLCWFSEEEMRGEYNSRKWDMFVPNFVKICQLVQTLKWTDTHRWNNYLETLIFILQEGEYFGC